MTFVSIIITLIVLLVVAVAVWRLVQIVKSFSDAIGSVTAAFAKESSRSDALLAQLEQKHREDSSLMETVGQFDILLQRVKKRAQNAIQRFQELPPDEQQRLVSLLVMMNEQLHTYQSQSNLYRERQALTTSGLRSMAVDAGIDVSDLNL